MDGTVIAEVAALAGGAGAALGSLVLAGIGVRVVGPFVDARIAAHFEKKATADSEEQRITAVVTNLVRRDDSPLRTHVDNAVDKLRTELRDGHTELRDAIGEQRETLARIEGVLKGRGEIQSPPNGNVIPPGRRLAPEDR